MVACWYESPLGRMLLAADGDGLCGAWFEGQRYFGRGVNEDELREGPSQRDLAAARRWLDAYFSGADPGSAPRLCLAGTALQRAVWQRLLRIPRGSTVTYGEIARELGTSARAVGSAVGRNPVSVIVPCHRVVGADGSLTGYAGGMGRKRVLLELEGVELGERAHLSFAVRPLAREERPLLGTFLREAVFTMPGEPRPPRSVIDVPEVRAYIEGFGERAGDIAVCADEGGAVVGAAWARLIKSYGYLHEGVPEIAVAVLPAWRGRGAGTALLAELIARCRAAGFSSLSLSVQRANPARRLYERLGFVEVGGDAREALMLLTL